MTKTFSWTVLLHFAVVTMIINVAYIQNVNAQTSCGNIIEVEDGVEFASPIDDCDLPFGPINTNASLEVSFDGVQIEDGGVYPLAGTTDLFEISGVAPFSSGTLYKHRDVDYVAVAYLGQTVTLTPGTYSLYLIEEELILTRTLSEKLFALIAPVAHAASGDYTRITFEITEPELEPEVDELILKYAPILYFHPSEDYFPMDVESFVEASALWTQESSDTQLYSSSSLTFEEFENIIESGTDTSDMYLAFSDPNNKKSIDVERAHDVYGNTNSIPVTYYRRMVDSGFTVLQYWYFYAMNNWGEVSDDIFTNNHEGDWESIFVFLDDEDPKYVAYSAHHNDGKNEVLNPLQYSSVRREWGGDEVVKDGDQVISFVAQGSHANYPNNNGGEHNTGLGVDKTSIDGDHLMIDTFSDIDGEDVVWDEYQGKWGADQVDILNSDSGPFGPKYSAVSGHNRFENPVQWAGIDKIVRTTLDTETLEVLFPEQEISVVFDIVIPEGTTIEVSPHNEVVTFGLLPNDSEVLPHFWDIQTTLPENIFTAQLTLPYNLNEIEALGYAESDIVGAYYDPVLNTWTYFPATFDSTAHTATFNITHFSRYALALVESEDEEETATSTEPVSAQKKKTSSYGTRIIREKSPVPEVLGAATSTVSIAELEKLVFSLSLLVGKTDEMTNMQKDSVRKLLKEVAKLVNNLQEAL